MKRLSLGIVAVLFLLAVLAPTVYAVDYTGKYYDFSPNRDNDGLLYLTKTPGNIYVFEIFAVGPDDAYKGWLRFMTHAEDLEEGGDMEKNQESIPYSIEGCELEIIAKENVLIIKQDKSKGDCSVDKRLSFTGRYIKAKSPKEKRSK